MEVALLDTNIISALFRANGPISLACTQALEHYSLPAISFMTQAELFAWPKLNRWGPIREKSLRQCISDYVVLYPDERTCEVLSDIKVISRLAGRPIGESDAWIAATAIRYQLPLITRNHRDFDFIDDLELIPVSDPSSNP